jgi:hypothetical protein
MQNIIKQSWQADTKTKNQKGKHQTHTYDCAYQSSARHPTFTID